MLSHAISRFKKIVLGQKEIFILIGLNLIFFSRLWIQNGVLLEGNLLSLYYPWKAALRSVLTKPYNMFYSDGVFYIYPFYHWAVESLRAGILPLWNPLIGGGMPFWGAPTFPFFYPGAILFRFLQLPTAWNLSFVLHLMLAGVGMYAYLRVLKVSRYGSLVAAVVYNFGGFSFTFLPVSIHIYCLPWTPWVFFCFERFWRTRGFFYLLACALLLSVQISIGQWIFSYFLLFLLSVYFLFRLVSHYIQERKISDVFYYGICFLVLLVIVAGVMFSPFMAMREILSVSARGKSAFMVKNVFGATPWYFLIGYWMPNFFGNTVDFPFWGDFQFPNLNDYTSVAAHYLGILPLIFLGVSVLYVKKNQFQFFFLTISILLLLANFDMPNPLFLLPTASLLKNSHNRLVFLLAFTLPVCIAYAVDYFLREEFARRRVSFYFMILKSITGIVLAGIAVGAVLYGFRRLELMEMLSGVFQNSHLSRSGYGGAWIPYELLNGIFLAIMLILGLGIMCRRYQKKLSLRWFKWAAGFLIVFDLFFFGMRLYPVCEASRIYPVTESILFLRKHIGNQRMMNYGRFDKTPEVFRSNIPQIYGIRDAGYFGAFPSERYRSFLSLISAKTNSNLKEFNKIHTRTYVHGVNFLTDPRDLESPLLDLLGVKYVVSSEEIYRKEEGGISLLDLFPTAKVDAPAERYAFPQMADIDQQSRKVLFQNSRSEVHYSNIRVSKMAGLYFGIGMLPECWNQKNLSMEDGVEFKITVTEINQPPKVVFSKVCDPRNNPADRLWSDQVVDLSAFGDKVVGLTFSVGPLKNPNRDFAVWSDPVILRKPKEFPWKPVFEREMKIYENEDVMPRAFAINRYQRLKNRKAVRAFLADRNFRPQDAVVLEESEIRGHDLFEGGTVEQAYFRPATIIDDGPNRVELTADVPADGILVLADNTAAGWKAFIDNEEVKIWTAYLTFRSVFLPKGEHKIVFVYQPDSFYKYGKISVFSVCFLILGLVFLWVRDFKKASKK